MDMENKSPDELIAMATKSKEEFKDDMLYRQAATKLIEQGDTRARARS